MNSGNSSSPLPSLSTSLIRRCSFSLVRSAPSCLITSPTSSIDTEPSPLLSKSVKHSLNSAIISSVSSTPSPRSTLFALARPPGRMMLLVRRRFRDILAARFLVDIIPFRLFKDGTWLPPPFSWSLEDLWLARSRPDPLLRGSSLCFVLELDDILTTLPSLVPALLSRGVGLAGLSNAISTQKGPAVPDLRARQIRNLALNGSPSATALEHHTGGVPPPERECLIC
mmetsp:Transcript_42527/g.110242  ORF Transcript_42527/g.110242 Transcript_42527/m.110242 type:complete len:226 (-) Transcript_42527:338-1015(-)